MQLTQEELQERRDLERRWISQRRLIETSIEHAVRLTSNRLRIAQRRQTHTAEENAAWTEYNIICGYHISSNNISFSYDYW